MTKAVALGDLSKRVEVDAKGEILDLKNTVNGMVVRFVDFVSFALCLLSVRPLGTRARPFINSKKAYNLNLKLIVIVLLMFALCSFHAVQTSHVSPTLPYERWIRL